jgi:hypothetical protein
VSIKWIQGHPYLQGDGGDHSQHAVELENFYLLMLRFIDTSNSLKGTTAYDSFSSYDPT